MSEKEKKLIENVIRKTAEVDDRAAEAVQAFAVDSHPGLRSGGHRKERHRCLRNKRLKPRPAGKGEKGKINGKAEFERWKK